MQDSLSNLVDNLSGIDNKEPENKFVDTMRSMMDSLSLSANKISEIGNKISQCVKTEQENKFIDTMRFMMTSLSLSIDKISEIDKKIMQIGKKEQENKFIDNMRSMMVSLSLSIDKISEIDKRIMQIDKKEPENKSIDNMRSMMASLSQSIDKVSEIDRKISYKFSNTYQLCNKDLNKFALLLRKGVYPYEYMDSWKRFKEESLSDKEFFYSELNNEHITDQDHAHAQKVWDTFKIKNLGEYHDLYVQSNASLLADVFENFRNKCIEKYELGPAHFLSAPRLEWQVCLKKTSKELELLTNPDMLLTFEDGTRGVMCNAIHRYAKASNKYMKNYNKNVKSSFLEYLEANNLYGWATSKKLPVGEFELINPENYTKDIIKKI